jgi:hypothetical protein
MSGKILFNGASPVTQKTDAVEALAAYLGKEISGDGVLNLGNFKLVRSNKGDAFYGVTATKCSCPAASYHHGPCKHQRKFFPQVAKPLATEPESIRPTGKWPGGRNGPVDEIMGVA